MARRAYRSGRVPTRGGQAPESTAIPKPLLFGGIAGMAALLFFLWTRVQAPQREVPEAPPVPEVTETRVRTLKPARESEPEKPVPPAPVMGLPAREVRDRPALEEERADD